MRVGAYHSKASKRNGFSLVELMIVLAIICVIAGMSYPNLQSYLANYRIAGDARKIASQLALARMRSAGDFNQERVNIDQVNGTFEMDVCTKGGGASGWTNENGAAGVFALSPGVSFGFGTITTPANLATVYQTSIAQTAPITFNSRGIPIILAGDCLAGNPTPTGNNFIYLSGQGGLFYAVSVNPGGKITVLQYSGSNWLPAGY